MSSGKKGPLEDESQSDDPLEDESQSDDPLEDESQSDDDDDDDDEDRDRAASTSSVYPRYFYGVAKNFHFILTERKMRRVIEKFNMSETYFQVKASYTPRSLDLVDTRKDVNEGLVRVFGAVLEMVSGDLNPNDLMSFRMMHSLNRISTGLHPFHQMTPEKILSIFQEGVPPGEEIPINVPLNIDVLVKRS